MLTFERVDSSGDVFIFDASAGGESLFYRLSDTSNSWWMSNGFLHRFDSCVVKDIFGQPRKSLYVGNYDAADTTLRAQVLLVDSIGYYTTILYGIVDGTAPPVLQEARIDGVYYGPSPEVMPALDFYPLEVGNRWNYHLEYTYGYDVVNTANVEIRVIGDTLMPNGHVYAQLSQPDVLGASFVRADSNFIYYYSRYDETDVPMYDLRAPADTRDSVHWGGVASSFFFSMTEDSLLGVRRMSRSYHLGGLVFYDVTLTDGIGISRGVDMGDGAINTTRWELRGAVIRDTVYGVPVHVGDKGSPPSTYTLFQNYPNPFNPSTTIRYALPHRSYVTLTVFNILGQQAATLVDGEVEAGHHEVRFDGKGLASGVYFYRIEAGSFSATRRLIVLK